MSDITAAVLHAEVTADTEQAESALSGFSEKVTGLWAGFGAAVGEMGAKVIESGIDMAKELVKSGVEINASMEVTAQQFTAFTGNADVAKQKLSDLYAFAKNTPFQTADVVQAGEDMIKFGGVAFETAGNLKLIGDAAAAVGAPIDSVATYVTRIHAAMEAGTAITTYTKKLSALGIITQDQAAQLNSMNKAGASADQQWGVLTTDLGRWNGQMVAQMGSWAGLKAQLDNVKEEVSAQVGKPLFDSIKVLMQALIDLTKTDAFTKLVDMATNAMTTIAGKLTDLANKFINFVGAGGIGDLADKFKGIWDALSKGGPAIATITGFMQGGWLGALAALIGSNADLQKSLMDLLPLLGQALAPVLEALVPVFQVISKALADLATILGPVIANVVKALLPVVVALAQAFGQIVVAITPLIPVLANIVIQFVNSLLPALPPILDAFKKLVPTIPALADALIKVMIALTPLIPVLTQVFLQAILQLVPMIPQLSKTIIDLTPTLITLVTWFVKASPAIMDVLKWTTLLNPIFLGFVAAIKLISIIKDVPQWFDDMKKAFSDAFDTVKKTVEDFWNDVKKTFDDGIAKVKGVFNDIKKFFEDTWNDIKKTFDDAVKDVGKILDTLKSFFQPVLDVVSGVINWIGEHWKLLVILFTGPIGIIVLTILNWWDAITDIFQKAFDFIFNNIVKPFMGFIYGIIKFNVDLVIAVFQAIKDFFTNILGPAFMWLYNNIIVPVWNWITKFVSDRWNDIKATFTEIVNFVQGILSTIWTFWRDNIIKPVWDFIVNIVKTDWGTLKGILDTVVTFVQGTFTDVWHTLQTTIKGVWDTIKSDADTAWQAIWGVIKPSVNFVIGAVNAIINGINSVTKILVGGGANIDPIPKLAQGGKTQGPAVLVGEGNSAYPEYVIPTDPQYRMRAHMLTAQLLQDVGAPGLKGGGIFGSITGAVKSVVGTGESVVKDATGVVTSGFDAAKGLLGDVANLVRTGAVDVLLNPMFDIVNSIMEQQPMQWATDAIKAVETKIRAWVLGNKNNVIPEGPPGYEKLTSWLGVPYLWGGGHGVSEAIARAQGVDCSGLVDQVYGQTGNTGTQINIGAAIPDIKSAIAGDLLFYGTRAAGEPHHVGIYVGNNQQIDAPHTGTVVRYDPIYSDLEAIRRWGKTSAGANAVGGTAGPGTAASNQALGQQMAAAFGWTGAEWTALNNIVMRESGWSSTAQNPTSSAYGIAQNIQGLAGYGPGGNNPGVQIQWLLNYILGRYGAPDQAWAHELAFGWYDGGGVLKPGWTAAYNGTGHDEYVSPSGSGTGTVTIAPGAVQVTVNGTVTADDLQAVMDQALTKFAVTLKRQLGGR